jgi:hypothetical protein
LKRVQMRYNPGHDAGPDASRFAGEPRQEARASAEERNMKNFARKAILAVSALALACGMAFVTQANSATRTLTGVVSDSMCGKTHNMKGMTDAQCTRMCVKKEGASFALVGGDKVIDLRGDSEELNKYAARKVTVRGTMHGKDFLVESVKPAK